MKQFEDINAEGREVKRWFGGQPSQIWSEECLFGLERH